MIKWRMCLHMGIWLNEECAYKWVYDQMKNVLTNGYMIKLRMCLQMGIWLNEECAYKWVYDQIKNVVTNGYMIKWRMCLQMGPGYECIQSPQGFEPSHKGADTCQYF